MKAASGSLLVLSGKNAKLDHGGNPGKQILDHLPDNLPHPERIFPRISEVVQELVLLQALRACLKIQSGWDGTAKMGRRTAQIPHFDVKIGLATALLNHLGEF